MSQLRPLLINTRPQDEAQTPFDRALRRLPVELLHLPVIERVPVVVPDLEAQLARYNWLIFTSQSAVRFLCQQGPVIPDLLKVRLKVAAVAESTAKEVRRSLGIAPDLVGVGGTGRTLAAALEKLFKPGDRAALLGAEQLAGGVMGYQWAPEVTVDHICLYRTQPKEIAPEVMQSAKELVGSAMLQQRSIGIVFFSPSAVKAWFLTKPGDLLNATSNTDLSGQVTYFSVGPTTTETLSKVAHHRILEAALYSSRGVLAIISDWCREISSWKCSK